MPGKVTLIGAGPGDPGLITVKGLRALQSADVVLYDRLIAPELLNEIRPDAKRIDVGKVSYRSQQRYSQEEINAAIVDHAHNDKHVVRLKGGDPFVFGRGGEEVLACVEAGIPFEVIPGVSSAIAVPAYAGIPVTQRGINSVFTVFAGHEDPTKADSNIDFAALAGIAQTGTLVLLMGVINLSGLIDQLIAHGLDPHIPAACIAWGTRPEQRVVTGSAGTLAALVKDASIQPPATTVIGHVVTLRDQLDWFSGVPAT